MWCDKHSMSQRQPELSSIFSFYYNDEGTACVQNQATTLKLEQCCGSSLLLEGGHDNYTALSGFSGWPSISGGV